MKKNSKEYRSQQEINNNTEVAYDIASSSYSEIKEDFINHGGNIPLLAAAHAVLSTFKKEKCINILDVGCGTGHDMLMFPEILNKMSDHELKVGCMGCDLSGKMIKICKSKGLKVTKGDFMEVSSEFNIVHLLWSHMSIIHLKIENIQQFLNTMFQLTLPKGFLAIGYKKANIDDEIVQPPQGKRVSVERFTNLLTEETVCEKLNKAGFDNLLIKLEIPSEHDEYNYGYVITQKNNLNREKV